MKHEQTSISTLLTFHYIKQASVIASGNPKPQVGVDRVAYGLYIEEDLGMSQSGHTGQGYRLPLNSHRLV